MSMLLLICVHLVCLLNRSLQVPEPQVRPYGAVE